MSGDPERIKALDYIRGLSILGILMVNAIAFAQPFQVYSNPMTSPLPLSQADIGTWWVIETFFKEKFITAFNMLFGVSMFLVGRDQGSGQKGGMTGTPLFRRLVWLAIFGLVHGALIWHGDILLAYALTGFLLWRWRGAEARTLILLGMAYFLFGALIELAPFIVQYSNPHTVPEPAVLRPAVAMMQGSFWNSLAESFIVWATTIVPELIVFLPATLGLMMLGLGLFKSGILSGQARRETYLAFVVAGLLSLLVIGIQSWWIVHSGFAFPDSFGWGQIANTVLCLPVALGYASGLILLGRTRIGAALLYPLACAGRMAFTNYLTQSLVMTGLFYGGRGLFGHMAWFGTMNHAALVPIVATIWVAQLTVSTLWLQLFRYGPFEWVWRCLTYGRRMPILKNSRSS